MAAFELHNATVRAGGGTILDNVDLSIDEGQFVADQRQGTGVFTGTDGYRYEGEWVEGRIEGKGTVTYPDGSVHLPYRGELRAAANRTYCCWSVTISDRIPLPRSETT